MSGAIAISIEEIQAKFPELSEIVAFKVGGQKSVFRAKHASLGDIALKLIPPGEGFDRVEREIDVMKRLAIANVPKIHETGYVDCTCGRLFFIFEQFINGVSLRDRYSNGAKMSKGEAVGLLDAMLSAIVAMEGSRVIHRDIKPDNILVGEDGKYWLIDFGAVQDMDGKTLTMTGKCAPLTPGYAAPEQFKAELKKHLDSRADLFALGVTVYEMISGANPFVRTDYGVYDVLRSTIVETADTLEIPGDERGDLAGFIKTLMQKNPTFRPPSAKWAQVMFKGLAI